MTICFEKLVSLGVLMVGELDSTLIYRPSFSHQESTNHQGLDVNHFECFQIVVPLSAWFLGFLVPGVSPQRPWEKSRLPKSQYMVTVFNGNQWEKMLVVGWRASKVFIASFVNSNCQLFLRW